MSNLGLGNALDLAGQGTEARTHFTKAIAAASDDTRAQALTAMAISFAFEGNAREAATFYQQVYDKQTAAANFGAAAGTANALGRVYLETGDLANAKRWYQTGLEAAKRQPSGDARSFRCGNSAGPTRRPGSQRERDISTKRESWWPQPARSSTPSPK